MAKESALGGRVLTDDELRQFRQQIEEFDSIEGRSVSRHPSFSLGSNNRGGSSTV